jgi:PAS domain S-box-containing protein
MSTPNVGSDGARTLSKGEKGPVQTGRLEVSGRTVLVAVVICSSICTVWALLAARVVTSRGITGLLLLLLSLLPLAALVAWLALSFARAASESERERLEAQSTDKEVLHQLMLDGQLIDALLEHFPGHVYFKDLESRFIKISASMARKFGLANSAQAAGKSDFDFFTEDHARPAFEDEQEIIRTGQPIHNKEEKETWSSGMVTWGSTTKMPLLDRDGNVIGTFGVTSDITARRQAEELLKDSRALFDSVVNSLPQRLLCKDEAGRYTFVNAAFCADLGKPIEEIVGKTDLDLYPKEVAERNRREDLTVIRRGLTFDNVSEIVAPDGEKAYIHITKSPTYDSEHNIVGVQALSWDVTDAKVTEERLARERDLLHSLMDNIPDLIYFKDNAGRFTRINKAEAELLGVRDPEDAIGKTDFDFFPPTAGKSYQNDEIELYATGKPLLDKVEEVKRRDGTPLWVLTTKVPIKERDGSISGLVGISKDITERKQAEEALETNMAALREVVRAVSEGDLTKRGTTGDDTLGRIANSVNRMLDDIGRMLRQVKELGISVSTSAAEILAASEQIAEGSQRQTDEVTTTSVSVEEMAASMGQVSRHAEAAADAARRAYEMAERGEKSVLNTAEAMSRIENAVQSTAEKMHMLTRSSTEISEIIALINEIAAQTNLLSLNAAIEAAHAGDAGVGFSVVAEEIRKLAERATRATKDVSGLIRAIQAGTEEAQDAMEKGLDEVRSGAALSEEARRSLQDISAVVRESSQMILEISSASDEQARVTTAVARAMQMISSIAIQTTAGAHESARTIQGMANLAEELNEAISQFRIESGASGKSYNRVFAPKSLGPAEESPSV